jgi:hypothetical protein
MDEPVQTNIRLPQALRDRLKADADTHLRSFTQQLVAILAEHYRRQDIERAMTAAAEVNAKQAA